MTQSMREAGRNWFELVWNQGRREAITELLTPSLVLHDGGVDSVGAEPFLQFFDRMQATFSSIHVDIDQTLVEGDKVCVRWVCTAKHTGDGFGIPPTGAQIHVTGISLIQFKDGKFIEVWQNWDMMGMMEQIKGLAQSPTYVAA